MLHWTQKLNFVKIIVKKNNFPLLTLRTLQQADVFPTPSNSPTPAEWPTIQFNTDTSQIQHRLHEVAGTHSRCQLQVQDVTCASD